MIKGAAARNATTPLCSVTNSDLLGQNPDQTANPSHEERIVRLSAGIAVSWISSAHVVPPTTPDG